MLPLVLILGTKLWLVPWKWFTNKSSTITVITIMMESSLFVKPTTVSSKLKTTGDLKTVQNSEISTVNNHSTAHNVQMLGLVKCYMTKLTNSLLTITPTPIGSSTLMIISMMNNTKTSLLPVISTTTDLLTTVKCTNVP